MEDPEIAWIDGDVLEIKGADIKIKLTSGKEVSFFFVESIPTFLQFISSLFTLLSNTLHVANVSNSKKRDIGLQEEIYIPNNSYLFLCSVYISDVRPESI